MIARLLIYICCFGVTSSFCEAVDGGSTQNLQNKLNSVISETILQNANFFPSMGTTSVPRSDLKQSSIHSLCSKMQPNDPDRNRVGCCQHSKMKTLYNVKLHNGKFRYMYSESNHSRGGIILPVLNSLRYKHVATFVLMFWCNINSIVHFRLLRSVTSVRMQKLIRQSEISNAVSTYTNKTASCKQYFNGTLHISPDRTYHKLYHAGID